MSIPVYKNRRQTIYDKPEIVVLLVAVGITMASTANGQFLGDEDLDFDRPESWAMKYFASVLLPLRLNPNLPEEGGFYFSFDISQVPQLSEAQRRVGFNGTKVEDINGSPVLVQPTVGYALPYGFVISASYVPPITIYDVKTEVYSVQLDRHLYQLKPFTLSARIFGQYARSQGHFTCSPGDASSPNDPFGCDHASSDVDRSRVFGGQILASFEIAEWGGLSYYAGLNAQYMDLEFEVNAERFGRTDNRRLRTDGYTWGFLTGISYPFSPKISVGAALAYSPLDIDRPNQSPGNDDLVQFRSQITYLF